VIKAIIENLGHRCQCTITAAQLKKRGFQCFASSPQAVTYRAELHGNREATVAELLEYMQQWVQEANSISVQFQFLIIDSLCAVRISSFSDGECRAVERITSSTGTESEQTSEVIVIAAAIGATLLVVLVVVVTLVTGVLVGAHRRHQRSLKLNGLR